jgi:cyclic beta-1,2-glucan synthetase
MFRVALESVLGLTMTGGDTLLISPSIPAAWPGFSIRYRLANELTAYEIEVTRGESDRTVGTLDDAPLAIEGRAVMVPVRRDGQQHRVRITLGPDVGPVYVARHLPG